MSRRVVVVLAHVLAWALLVTGLSVVLLERRDAADPAAFPGSSSGPRYAAMPFPATLSLGTTTGGDRVRVGSPVRLRAEGVTPGGIASAVLYDGGRVVDVVRPPRGSASVAADLTFPTLSVGSHTVHAVVTDVAGAVSETAPVSLIVGAGPGDQPLPVSAPALPGEDVRAVAARLAVPVETVLAVPGGTARLAVAPDAGADLIAADGLTVRAPSASTAATDAAGAFTLTATPDGCGVRLRASGAPDDVTYFVGGGGTGGWLEVGRTVADLGPGSHVFFARSGGRESPRVEVVAPQRCAAGFGWQGEASIVDGVLALPASVPGVGYVLLSVDGRPWIRVPGGQDEFLSLGTRTSLAHLLPRLDGHRLELEVWKAGEFPTRVAGGVLKVPGDRTLASVVGEPSALDLTVDGGPANSPYAVALESTDRSLALTWRAASSAVTRVRWQVLSVDPGRDDVSLVPPGLLASGVSPVDGDQRTGTFTVDTAKIPRLGREGAGATTGATPVAVALRPLAPAGALAPTPAYASIVPVADLGAAEPAGEPLPLPAPGATVFVRVVAETGPAASSDTVTVRLPAPQSKSSGVDFTVDSFTVDGGRAPDPKAIGCLIVTVPWDGAPLPTYDSRKSPAADFLPAAAAAFYPRSGTYCPGAFPPPQGCDEWYCEVVEFVVDAVGAVVDVVVQLYSLVSYVYDGVVSGVVSAIAKYNPLCVGLGAADDDAGSGCEVVVGAATRAAVTAVMASVGLPPTLPSTEQLKAIAAGELDELGVELMKQAGIPCDDLTPPAGFDDALTAAGSALGSPAVSASSSPCRAVARLLIDTVRDRAEAGAEQALADASGLPSFASVPGFTMVPDPRGRTEPMRISLSVTPAEDDADTTDVVCRVVVDDPDRPGLNRMGPFQTFEFGLLPSGPGGRSRTGEALRLPDASPGTVAGLAGVPYATSVRSYGGAGCRIPLTRSSFSLAPPG